MDALSIAEGWKRRLVALAENPPYVFRDTPQDLIDQHRRRLTTFVGYSESELSEAEDRLGLQFPTVFRTFLREMAKSPGDLFRGSDLARITQLQEFKTTATRMLATTDATLTLPDEAVVFLFCQGYTFLYFLAGEEFDTPLMQWTEQERVPTQVAPTFADLIDAELRLMESVSAGFRDQGGYYLTLYPDGGTAESFPPLASGERPLDRAAEGNP